MKNIVVGAGISGAVVANLLAEKLSEEITVLEQRVHIAGNCFDYKEDGITVQKYGAHIFHTDNIEVWKFLRRYTDFNQYMHKVVAVIDGIHTTIPFSIPSIYSTFPPSLAQKLERKLLEKYTYGSKVPISDFLQQDDEDLRFLANFVYDKIFKDYTAKQWGVKVSELSSKVSSRVPVNISMDQRYFTDKYQGIPVNGYTEMIQRILDHKLISVKLNSCFSGDLKSELLKDSQKGLVRIFYTGSIDELLDYKYGVLPYRSLKFEFSKVNRDFYQENSVVNYPCNYDFTRIHEFKYFLSEQTPSTIIAKEYPIEYKLGENERYYPIDNHSNNSLYQRYKEHLQATFTNVFVLGRLGDYHYYDMDDSVEKALNLIHSI
ncbi:UDP-galactopyranose mutase [uncultured Succinivibrio sp.]|uniref:UDP-galactopyranose mutase n=1 Tax=uncultured Succinivibrio sp. TaxID=540749 RepID=UPI0025ED75CA|nr:UDP-galactopyranose mutase [uncultured Succinivibrio sp.]